MKVLLISHSSDLFGSQRSLLDLAQVLPSLGVEPLITVPNEGPLIGEAEALGLKVEILPCRNWFYTRGTYQWIRKWLLNQAEARRAARRFATYGFDLIHTNSSVTPIGALIAKRMKLPHVWHVREGMPPQHPRKFFLPLEKVKRFVDETTQRVIGISKADCEGMPVFAPESKVRLVHNGPIGEADASRPLPDRARLSKGRRTKLLCVGRSGPKKGHDDAVSALAMISHAGYEAELTIVGPIDPDVKKRLVELASEGGVEDRLHLAGFTKDVEEHYRAADIYLMTSHKEAFGRVTVEAMSHGCLMIGTNSGGTPDIVTDGETGLLYTPQQPGQLAQCIRRLVDNPELAESLRSRAHADVFQRFTRERYARDVVAVYREALAEFGLERQADEALGR